MLTDLAEPLETVEDTLHRILGPMVQKHGETRLQRLADSYRKLSPELQLEAIIVLKQWQASKVPTP